MSIDHLWVDTHHEVFFRHSINKASKMLKSFALYTRRLKAFYKQGIEDAKELRSYLPSALDIHWIKVLRSLGTSRITFSLRLRHVELQLSSSSFLSSNHVST